MADALQPGVTVAPQEKIVQKVSSPVQTEVATPVTVVTPPELSFMRAAVAVAGQIEGTHSRRQW
jgi:hypothetical protein